MKYSYVAEVLSRRGPVLSRQFRKELLAPGWIEEDPSLAETLTFGEYLTDHWLPSIELEVEPTTFTGYESSVRTKIVPRLGSVLLRDVTRDLIKNFYLELMTADDPRRGRPLAKASVERTHATIHRSLAVLVEAGVLHRNPAAGARPRRRKMDRYEILTWTPGELKAFLDATKASRLGPLWRVLAFTGVRRGEALGLRWGDLRFDAGLLAVRRALNITGSHVYLSTPKSAQARVLEIDPQTVRVLRSHKKRCIKGRASRGLRALDGGTFVFTRPDGDPCNPTSISRTFRRLVKEAGLPLIRLHDLRHTHASHLIESGANPKVVQERLGHADVVITLNIYSHLFPTTQRSAVTNLTRFYR